MAMSVSARVQAHASTYKMETFNTWLLQEERAGRVDNELAVVLSSIATACKQIANLVQRAGISNLTGLQGETNVQGEDQKKLDVISNEVFCNCLEQSGRTGIIASEEEDVPVAVETSKDGKYICVFDPLDGSSNIDAAVSTGSIWGIYEPSESCVPTWGEDGTAELDEVTANCITNVCQPGENLVCAGYCMYSSSVILVLTVGDGVYGFTLDPSVGEFILSHDNVKIPETGKIYSFNEGNAANWDQGMKDYINFTKAPEGPGSKAYSARYIGSLVGDFHRTMLYGGVYGYPGDAKNPNGKLRLLYECAPMSFIAEQAGGAGSDGKGRVMEILPTEVHQRVPLFVGSKGEVKIIEEYISKANVTA
jgi:fructose-1,6-bisphosphatase I